MTRPTDLTAYGGDPERPEAPRPVRRHRLHGRDAETASLRRTIAEILDGRTGAVVLLGGESGAGKTALAEWVLAEAKDSNFFTVRATCEPFHAGMSFFPIQELSRKLAGEQGVEALIAAEYGPDASETTVARRAFSDDTDPAIRREYLMATFANAVMAKTKALDGPVVAFVDDLERIDVGSVDALTVLMSRLDEGRVLLLGAFRSDIVTADKQHNLRPLVERLRRGQPHLSLVEVRPIAEEFVRPIFEDFLEGPSDVTDHFLRRLYTETEGNPLFIREVIRSLQNKETPSGQPALMRDESGTWHFDAAVELWDIPQSVEDAIGNRLLPLSDSDREVADAASVIGRKFKYETLLELTKRPDDALVESIDSLMERELVREIPGSDDFFEFAHGKIRDVLYSQMTGLRRTRLHAQVADVLELQRGLFEPDEWDVLVGQHLFAARKYDAAAPHLLESGRRALRVQAAQEAAARFSRCLEALEKSNSPDPRKISDVRLLLGEALKLASDLDGAVRELSLVAKSEDSPVAFRWALNHLGDIAKLRDEVDAATGYYERTEEAATQANDRDLLAENAADLAELHMRQAERLAGTDPSEASSHRERYQHYLELETVYASESDSREAKARSFRNRAKYERANGSPDVAIPLYERSLEYMDEGVSSHQFLIPYAKALRLVGRTEDAKRVVHSVLDWSRQIGAPRSEAIARQYLGLLLFEDVLAGRGDASLALAKEELSRALVLHEEVGFRQGYRETSVDLFEIGLYEGATDDAVRYLHQTDVYGVTQSTAELANALIAQLSANGERQRAERISALLARSSMAEPTITKGLV